MTRVVKELYEKAATLPPEERAELAELLLGTLPAKQHGRGNGEQTGAALVAAFRESPFKEIDLEPPRHRSRVRRVKL
jgi:hypothetical protein